MKQHITFQQYRAFDLAAFSVLLTVFEGILVTASARWFPDQLYTVSLAGAVTAIALMRWDARGLLLPALGGIVFCLFSHAEPQQYVIYAVGNLFSAAALLMLRLLGGERIRMDVLLSLVFGLLTLLLMQLGRGLMALLLGTPLSLCVGFITTDALSGLFTAVIIWIVRRLDGLFENQKHYLLRVQEEERAKKGGTV